MVSILYDNYTLIIILISRNEYKLIIINKEYRLGLGISYNTNVISILYDTI